jgi:hypothetical protein
MLTKSKYILWIIQEAFSNSWLKKETAGTPVTVRAITCRIAFY